MDVRQRLERRLAREANAREEAERLLEQKSMELFETIAFLNKQVSYSDQLLRAMEATKDGIAITDAEGDFSFMNLAHETMFDYGPKELIGRHWSTLYDRIETERFACEIMPVVLSEGVWRGEATGRGKTGRTVHQEVTLTMLPSGGMVCATRDVSLKRERESQTRALEAKLQKAERDAARVSLGRAVAHDFNNLISAIDGYAMLIRASLSDDPVNAGRAEQISRAVEQASSIIAALEPREDDAAPVTVQTNLIDIVRSAIDISRPLCPDNVRIVRQWPGEVFIAGDSVLLSRCILNIIKNAFEAMPGGGLLTITVARRPRPLPWTPTSRAILGPFGEPFDWIVEIADQGNGISQDDIATIFEPFFTTKSQRGGSGLGMQSLQTLAEQHNVAVEVESRAGSGTVFRLFLSTSAQPVEIPPEHLDEPVACPAFRSMRILLADDEPLVGQVMSDIMTQMGHEVALVRDGERALQALRRAPACFDVLITDYTMPGMKGDALIREARMLVPDLPCILISGETAYLNRKPGMAAVLRKPLSPRELDTALASLPLRAHAEG